MKTFSTQGFIFILIYLFFPYSMLFSQCPTGTCATHTTVINVDDLAECGVGGNKFDGQFNPNQNDDCDVTFNSNELNCWKFVVNNGLPRQDGIRYKAGSGNSCGGQIDQFFIEIDGVCTLAGTGGSQNLLELAFGINEQIIIYICDNSNGTRVSVCDLCAVPEGALPVEFSAFTGTPKYGMVELSWVTESETDNDRFEVQRSLDGTKFETIGEVTGHGTSTAMNYYQFMDKQALPFAYYRLKQVDFNGAFAYSPVISVERKGAPSKLRVYPTQAHEEVLIRMETAQSRKSIVRIANTSGQILRETNYGATNGTEYLTVDVSDYPAGVYYVALLQEKETITQKFIVVKD